MQGMAAENARLLQLAQSATTNAAVAETQRVNSELQLIREQLAAAVDSDARRAEVCLGVSVDLRKEKD